ncbi:MAG: nucleotidyltransferase domain-containing protein [Methanomassiliicoccaceae archaeon]|nr:nucleotidyltransferase domain-containing protein [Methanomassiliicoccaceae archaeon]
MSHATKEICSIDELKAIVAPVAESYGVAKIYLFGSVARGDYDEDSDYDFCIEKGKIRGLIALSGFFQDLRDAVGRDIDLVTTKSSNTDLLNVILSEGVVIYEG